MIELQGKYNSAKVFTDNVEQKTISQIINLLNQDFTKDCSIRIMPDCHAGKGCVIGFTANLGDRIIPNIVGVDIGCGMLTIELGKININLEQLDNIIHQNIPSGRNTHDERKIKYPKLAELHCHRDLKDTKRLERSIGTLGSGNHFIEVGRDNQDNLYLVIHSGSRNLGKQVAEHYQNIAIELRSGREHYYTARDKIIKEYKEQGRRKEIESALKQLDKKYKSSAQPDYPKELCFLEDKWKDKYLHDMKICQEYALLNRETMANIILTKLFGRACDYDYFHTTHNYISFKDNIIRKGSISAHEGERVLIPINMRDGSILAVGKGNLDWNWSAPHGAGRLMSRGKAKQSFTMEEYQQAMEGIYTTSVNSLTLDEAPMSYKPMEEIMSNIEDTVEILGVIKPIYNFKAGE
ncbi:MAG: RtcB family protein [Methanofastidiosum sp.]